jgi:hypothetical protein
VREALQGPGLDLTDEIPRIPAVRGNRLLLHNGSVVAVYQTGDIHWLREFEPAIREKASRALQLTQLSSVREELLKELVEPQAELRT